MFCGDSHYGKSSGSSVDHSSSHAGLRLYLIVQVFMFRLLLVLCAQRWCSYKLSVSKANRSGSKCDYCSNAWCMSLKSLRGVNLLAKLGFACTYKHENLTSLNLYASYSERVFPYIYILSNLSFRVSHIQIFPSMLAFNA